MQQKIVEDEIRTTGNVAVDETRLAYVQVRFSGYIQKVFADATYQYVHKGSRSSRSIAPISSRRNANTWSQNKINRSRAKHGARCRCQRSLARLMRPPSGSTVGQSPKEITRLGIDRSSRQELEIDSPVSGYITERDALPNSTFSRTLRLYTIADLSTVWVFAQVFQNDLGRMKIGDPATLTVDTFPGRTFSGRVDFIYPDIDMAHADSKVRLVFPNPNLNSHPACL